MTMTILYLARDAARESHWAKALESEHVLCHAKELSTFLSELEKGACDIILAEGAVTLAPGSTVLQRVRGARRATDLARRGCRRTACD
jgi:hypothetical protein